MNPFRSNVGTLNEILFKDKNKSYGAYAMRTSYEYTLLKSLGAIAAFILSGAWLLAILWGKDASPILPGTDDPILQTYTITIDPFKPEEQIDKPDKPKTPNEALKKNVLDQYVIKDKALMKDSLTPFNPDLPVNTSSVVGTSSVVTGPTGPPTFTPTTPSVSIEPTAFPDVAPKFDGDLKGFWASHLKYPTEAREQDIEGRVAVNFVIDEEGKLIRAKIIKKLGYGCDEEVLRVAKLMPTWTPGRLNGKPVKVSFSQVVDFKLK